MWGPRPYSLAEIIYEYDTEDEGQRGYERESQDRFFEHHTHPLHQYLCYLEVGGRRRCALTDTGDEVVYAQLQPGLQLEEGNWLENYNYIRPGLSSIRGEAYREWYETAHPRPYTLEAAIEYWSNRRRQLRRCQANHPLSYEAFLRANQPAEGHPADETWDYGQLYRLHMIRAQAAQDFKSFNITADDVDNYLIRAALADNQLDNDATSSSSTDQESQEVNELPPTKRTSSSSDRCEHRGPQQG